MMEGGCRNVSPFSLFYLEDVYVMYVIYVGRLMWFKIENRN